MIYVQAGTTFDATLEGAPTGLEGTVGVRVVDPTTETTVVARTTAGINEYPAGSGVYGVTLTAPALDGHDSPWGLSILWDIVPGGAPLAPSATFTEDLLVYTGIPPGVPPVVGQPYFTIAEFRARYPTLSTTEYTDAIIAQYRTTAERAIEDACGRAFVPRVATDTLHGNGGTLLQLTYPFVRTVLSATVDGTAVAAGDILVAGTSTVYYPRWASGYSNIVITYEHGADSPSGEAQLAAMMLAKDWMVRGPVSDRATQELVSQDGGTVNLATPGMFGTHFGIPAVDAFVASNRIPLGIGA